MNYLFANLLVAGLNVNNFTHAREMRACVCVCVPYGAESYTCVSIFTGVLSTSNRKMLTSFFSPC